MVLNVQASHKKKELKMQRFYTQYTAPGKRAYNLPNVMSLGSFSILFSGCSEFNNIEIRHESDKNFGKSTTILKRSVSTLSHPQSICLGSSLMNPGESAYFTGAK